MTKRIEVRIDTGCVTEAYDAPPWEQEQKGRPRFKTETARMMEVIAKMTEGMGGIKAVCVGNIIQNLWGLSSKQGIQDARNILDWLEENYDFG